MKQDIPIYFMFMKNDFFRFSGKPTTAEDIGAYPASWLNIFEDVANYTGGRLINAEPMGNLNDEAVKLADELKSQYVLGFASGADAKVAKWRNLKVSVKGAEANRNSACDTNAVTSLSSSQRLLWSARSMRAKKSDSRREVGIIVRDSKVIRDRDDE